MILCESQNVAVFYRYTTICYLITEHILHMKSATLNDGSQLRYFKGNTLHYVTGGTLVT